MYCDLWIVGTGLHVDVAPGPGRVKGVTGERGEL